MNLLLYPSYPKTFLTMTQVNQYIHYDIPTKQLLLLYLILPSPSYYIQILFESFCYLFTLVPSTFLSMYQCVHLLRFVHFFVLQVCSNFLWFVFAIFRMIQSNSKELTFLFDSIPMNYLNSLSFDLLFVIN